MTVLVLAVAAAVIALLIVLNLRWSRDECGVSVREVQADLVHRAPVCPLSADRAHELTQKHKPCSAEDCACKRAALRALYRAGKMTPTQVPHDLLFNRFGDEEPADRPSGRLR
ncbi:hypothetical protein ACIGO9_19160 [Nocardia asteroides]|uniref:hypothetical protein n=1 Tax=Nocardia asteroides TaxID=1824 RepID=UPI0037C99DF2